MIPKSRRGPASSSKRHRAQLLRNGILNSSPIWISRSGLINGLRRILGIVWRSRLRQECQRRDWFVNQHVRMRPAVETNADARTKENVERTSCYHFATQLGSSARYSIIQSWTHWRVRPCKSGYAVIRRYRATRPQPNFKTAALNHSATLPRLPCACRSELRVQQKPCEAVFSAMRFATSICSKTLAALCDWTQLFRASYQETLPLQLPWNTPSQCRCCARLCGRRWQTRVAASFRGPFRSILTGADA